MSDRSKRPLVVGFIADLFFSSRIERVLSQLGYEARWVESAAVFGEGGGPPAAETPGEALLGRSGRLTDQLARWQPALLLFDLGNEQIPWRRWLPLLKASPATRRIPVICYGPHVEAETLALARRAGADLALPRSRFANQLPELLQRYARQAAGSQLSAVCAEPLSPAAEEGIALHNQGRYFEAHEELEAAWKADEGAGRTLYQGMLQVSVAYLQIERGNYRGAVKMCLRLRQWLAPLPDQCRGIDVADLKQAVEQVHDALLALGEAGIASFDRGLLRPFKRA